MHSLSELPELVLAPAVADAVLVVEGLGVRLGQADWADVGLQAELGVEEEQGEVVVVVPGVQARVLLQGGQMLTVSQTTSTNFCHSRPTIILLTFLSWNGYFSSSVCVSHSPHLTVSKDTVINCGHMLNYLLSNK